MSLTLTTVWLTEPLESRRNVLVHRPWKALKRNLTNLIDSKELFKIPRDQQIVMTHAQVWNRAFPDSAWPQHKHHLFQKSSSGSSQCPSCAPLMTSCTLDDLMHLTTLVCCLWAVGSLQEMDHAYPSSKTGCICGVNGKNEGETQDRHEERKKEKGSLNSNNSYSHNCRKRMQEEDV